LNERVGNAKTTSPGIIVAKFKGLKNPKNPRILDNYT